MVRHAVWLKPATELAGCEVGWGPAGERSSFLIEFNLEGIAGASGVRVLTVAPNGDRSETDCQSSPCAVSAEGCQGDYS